MFHGRGAVVQAEALLVLLVSKCSTVRFADEDCNQQLNPRIFAKLIPRFKGASGAGGLLLNTKASQEAACSRAATAIVPGPEPARNAGVSRFGENGSHLEAADAAEGYAGQVDGPGSSRNAGTGSHLAGADFSDEPGDVLWRWSTPRRTESGLLLYGTSPQDSAVQKTALWCTQPSLWRRKICPVRITEKKGRSGSPHQRIARGRDFVQAKLESDSRRGRTSGAAERQRVCGANEQQRRPAEACQSPRTRTRLNGLTKKCSSEHRRGRGTLLRQSRKAT